MGASKVRDLFKQAKEKAPCIVFIDEIDAIVQKRNSSGMGGNDERKEAILKVHAKKIKITEDVDFHTIARMASGASGAELANIVNEAALRAVQKGPRL